MFEAATCHPALTPAAPGQDPYLERCFVIPPIYDTVLDPRSTLVCGDRGRGKSTLAYKARRATQGRWLNVDFPAEAGNSLYETLLRSITVEVWNWLEQNPHQIGALGSRAVALHYFLGSDLDLDLGFLLDRLADDNPHCAEAISQLRRQPIVELFRPHASPAAARTLPQLWRRRRRPAEFRAAGARAGLHAKRGARPSAPGRCRRSVLRRGEDPGRVAPDGRSSADRRPQAHGAGPGGLSAGL